MNYKNKSFIALLILCVLFTTTGFKCPHDSILGGLERMLNPDAADLEDSLIADGADPDSLLENNGVDPLEEKMDKKAAEPPPIDDPWKDIKEADDQIEAQAFIDDYFASLRNSYDGIFFDRKTGRQYPPDTVVANRKKLDTAENTIKPYLKSENEDIKEAATSFLEGLDGHAKSYDLVYEWIKSQKPPTEAEKIQEEANAKAYEQGMLDSAKKVAEMLYGASEPEEIDTEKIQKDAENFEKMNALLDNLYMAWFLLPGNESKTRKDIDQVHEITRSNLSPELKCIYLILKLGNQAFPKDA